MNNLPTMLPRLANSDVRLVRRRLGRLEQEGFAPIRRGLYPREYEVRIN